MPPTRGYQSINEALNAIKSEELKVSMPLKNGSVYRVVPWRADWVGETNKGSNCLLKQKNKFWLSGAPIYFEYYDPSVGIGQKDLQRYPRFVSVQSEQIRRSRWVEPTGNLREIWFDIFSASLATTSAENIYNMDETGFGIGMEQSSWIIIQDKRWERITRPIPVARNGCPW